MNSETLRELRSDVLDTLCGGASDYMQPLCAGADLYGGILNGTKIDIQTIFDRGSSENDLEPMQYAGLPHRTGASSEPIPTAFDDLPNYRIPQIPYENELHRMFHHTIVELSDCGGTDAYWAAYEMWRQPELKACYGFEQLYFWADRMYKSQILTLSKHFTEEFQRFSRLYFASKLPLYSVYVVYNIDIIDGVCSDGLIDKGKRRIWIRASGHGNRMTETLLHEMAHAATNIYHGKKWAAEIVRLEDFGAPISVDLTI